MTELAKAYDPREHEERLYQEWEARGYFRASDAPDDARPAYVIAIPPPNVTGSLHIGHACRTTFEDVLIRYKRMSGYNALWIPGTDHAGIATQVVVERQLKNEGLSRHDLGREKFVERVWKWKEQSGGTILRQLRFMGASCDWDRERFTMDPGLSRAVREVFVRLYEQGLMYRASRLINWCVDCRTALSDLEVETEENVQGEMFEFAYPVEGGGEVVVATTRPETMLGDTAVAVHPDDPRYTHLHGKFVTHPILARRIPVITDAELVDPKLGTGVVKVTPAHDPNDFATGKRHGLEEISILELDGRMNANAGPFAGLDRFKARKAVKERLASLGLTRGSKPHVMTLPRCQRSNTVVEPIISTQWFVRMEPLAKPAIEAVESGKTVIIPEDWTKTYYHWMRNIQDWCVSRQLWWGHPIPAWYCADGHVTVARETPSACSHCGASALTQDEDVLDTWFSSALWPFSTLGWPDETPALKRFYPTSDMETGSDILFFWVARMMMMGLHFMGEVPFRRVLLAGIVTDERGEKMSKVKGNVIDPLDVIRGATIDELVEKTRAGGAKESGVDYIKKTYPTGFSPYGADALRMTLLSYSPQTRRIALSMKRIEGYRNFANKLWNASRFVLMNLDGTDAMATGAPPRCTHVVNRWIVSRLHVALEAASKGLDDYRLDDASGALYHFVWDEFCDWYVEFSKALLAEKDSALAIETRATLVHVLETTLRALHPMMPFITEEIWQRVPKHSAAPASIVIATFPRADADALRDEAAERDVSQLQGITTAARTIRAEHGLARSFREPLFFRGGDDLAAAMAAHVAVVGTLVNAPTVTRWSDTALPADARIQTVGASEVFFRVPVDAAKERERLGRELAKAEKDLDVLTRKLANAGFVERAPADVVAQERQRQSELEAARDRLRAALAAVAG